MARSHKAARSKPRRTQPKRVFRQQVDAEVVDTLLRRFVELVKQGLELMLTQPTEWAAKVLRQHPEWVYTAADIPVYIAWAAWTAYDLPEGRRQDGHMRCSAPVSDKQAALVSAAALVFPHAQHGLCQVHCFKNAAEPVADADEALKKALRQTVRDEIGTLLRPKSPENTGVLTVTGLLPWPVVTSGEGPGVYAST
jgi:hypothetical protein